MKLTGLIGFPVGHSLSAVMHNAEFARLGLGVRYELWNTPPDELAAQVARLRTDMHVLGFNVTIPYKRDVMALLDEVDTTARLIGAVNTVVRDAQSGKLTGYNTDCDGWVRDVQSQFGAGALGADSHVLILGAGGVARAVVAGCVRCGVAAVTVACRDEVRGRAFVSEMELLCAAFGGATQFDWVSLASVPRVISPCITLVVNCTSVGMAGASEGESPLGAAPQFGTKMCVYDTIYRPAQTLLFHQATVAGCRGVSCGLGMLVWQGALAFEMWMGVAPCASSMQLSVATFL